MPKVARAPRSQRCVVCGRKAEVSHPDGHGDQAYYCGLHEPNLTFSDVLEADDPDLPYGGGWG